MDLGLQDKVAIVTGGSEGIGKAAALGMAREGARVLIVARRPDMLEQAAQEIKAATEGVVVPVPADVTDRATAGRVVQAALDQFGRVDILVNNAGTSMAKGFEEVSEEDWEGDFNLKVWGAVRFIRAVIPEMRKAGGGRIINVTNLAGRTPRIASMPTAISRAAGIAITKGLSKDLAKDNILVSTVCIGLIKSGQTERRYARAKESNPGLTMEGFWVLAAKERGIPMGRVGEPQEAGDVITFLASERARYLTGIAVNIDGGTPAVV
jgi:NAD(P)-dependent dehydrogenase (short-subunit alcohol dehydrogenase family)